MIIVGIKCRLEAQMEESAFLLHTLCENDSNLIYTECLNPVIVLFVIVGNEFLGEVLHTHEISMSI